MCVKTKIDCRIKRQSIILFLNLNGLKVKKFNSYKSFVYLPSNNSIRLSFFASAKRYSSMFNKKVKYKFNSIGL